MKLQEVILRGQQDHLGAGSRDHVRHFHEKLREHLHVRLTTYFRRGTLIHFIRQLSRSTAPVQLGKLLMDDCFRVDYRGVWPLPLSRTRKTLSILNIWNDYLTKQAVRSRGKRSCTVQCCHNLASIQSTRRHRREPGNRRSQLSFSANHERVTSSPEGTGMGRSSQPIGQDHGDGWYRYHPSNGALARLQIGRAYLMQRDMAKTRAAYNDFLTLWKDADPDIPILKQAKAEYAKLR